MRLQSGLGQSGLGRRIFFLVPGLILVALVAAIGIVGFGILSTELQGQKLASQITGINGQIFLQSAERPLTEYDRIVSETEKVPGVRRAVPLVEVAAFVASQTAQAGALVRGIREEDLKTLPGFAGHPLTGSFDGFDQAGGVAIGEGLAGTLGVHAGDQLSIVFAKRPSVPIVPRVRIYPIVATVQVGLPQFDGLFVFMPLQEAQQFFDHDKEATVIEVFLQDPVGIDAAKHAIANAASQPVVLTDWRERNPTFLAAMKTELDEEILIFALLVVAATGCAAWAYKARVFARASLRPQP